MSRREHNAKKRKNQVVKQKLIIICTAFLIICAGSIGFGSILTDAHEDRENDPVNYKYYKSIQLEKGDTLWDIAKEYKTDDQSINDYIDEVKEMNQLESDDITESQYLMIAYYDTEFK